MGLLASAQIGEVDYKLSGDRLVYDSVELLPKVRREALNNKLVAYADSTSTQIAVVIVNAVPGGQDINSFAAEIGYDNGIGQKGKDNGVLILLAYGLRQVSIQGGDGIQAKMPAVIEQLIIDREMLPYFKANDYYAGLDNGTNAIIRVLAGQYQAEPKVNEIPIQGIVFLLFFLFLLFSSYSNRHDDHDEVIISHDGRRVYRRVTGRFGGGFGIPMGGGGGGFSGGGGFGGFGGGGFGGGGASGSW